MTHQLSEVWELATRVAVLVDGPGLLMSRGRVHWTHFSLDIKAGPVPDSIRLALVIAAKDIRAELRSRTALLSALVFAALVLVVFNFARDPTVLAAADLAPSVLWVTFALASMVTLNRAFTVERENAALDGLLLAPVPREALFVGKAAGESRLRWHGGAGDAAPLHGLLQRRVRGRAARDHRRDSSRHDRICRRRHASSVPWLCAPGLPS